MNANTVAHIIRKQDYPQNYIQKGFDHMAKKRIVMALGHDALGTNLPEQKKSVAATAKLIASRMAGRSLLSTATRLRSA